MESEDLERLERAARLAPREQQLRVRNLLLLELVRLLQGRPGR